MKTKTRLDDRKTTVLSTSTTTTAIVLRVAGSRSKESEWLGREDEERKRSENPSDGDSSQKCQMCNYRLTDVGKLNYYILGPILHSEERITGLKMIQERRREREAVSLFGNNHHIICPLHHHHHSSPSSSLKLLAQFAMPKTISDPNINRHTRTCNKTIINNS